MGYEIGQWVWSILCEAPVCIIQKKELWGYKTYKIWNPVKDEIFWAEENDLGAVSSYKEFSSSEIIYKLSASKIKDALACDNILSPVEGNLMPLPHQIYTLNRAISTPQIRFLLADEVGLGKTIEAGLIIRELKLRGLVKRVLVVVPKGLVSQWQQEMDIHFNESFIFIAPNDFSTLNRIHGDKNYWGEYEQVITSIDSVKPLENRRGWTKERIDRENKERFQNLIQASWDLIIIDEAHKLSGSSESVARFKLGKALGEAAPYLLLLTATPHQGKTDGFYRLMSILDQRAFPNEEAIVREQVAPYVIRTEKREVVDAKGKKIFKPRKTQLIPVNWEVRHQDQKILYEAVTEYVREGYNQAMAEKKNYIGFLMVLMQRMVSSSTRAIREALERRRDMLKAGAMSESKLEWEELWELSGQELFEEIIDKGFWDFKNELEQVDYLLSLARRCETGYIDTKAEKLLSIINKLQLEENNQDVKFLVFTEFKATQNMLFDFLKEKGFSVNILNGSMEMDERKKAQQEFADDFQIMISTEAGGEGLNLQFCHLIVNYDLPWNPMRLEQRIGRVDRIGQKREVQAFNFLLKDTIEFRVQEVLEHKLQLILDEFGVDKTGDVLDSGQAERDFSDVYVKAIMNPNNIEKEVDHIAEEFKDKTEKLKETENIIKDDKEIDPEMLHKLKDLPLGYWIEKMLTGYIQSYGGDVEKTIAGYNLKWPDGVIEKGVIFAGNGSEDLTGNLYSLENKRVKDILEKKHIFIDKEPIPCLSIKGIPQEVKGLWSLWRVSLVTGHKELARKMPLFLSVEGKIFEPTARILWDKLLEESNLEFNGFATNDIGVQRIFEAAKKRGFDIFKEIEEQHNKRMELEEKKGKLAFRLRREAIERMGLENVRKARRKDLQREEKKWQQVLEKDKKYLPELTPICVIYLEGK